MLFGFASDPQNFWGDEGRERERQERRRARTRAKEKGKHGNFFLWGHSQTNLRVIHQSLVRAEQSRAGESYCDMLPKGCATSLASCKALMNSRIAQRRVKDAPLRERKPSQKGVEVQLISWAALLPVRNFHVLHKIQVVSKHEWILSLLEHVQALSIVYVAPRH